MKRASPRPLAAALDQVARESAPTSTLASVQRCWKEVVGDAVARESEPVFERDGVVTVACRSAAWAQELDLMSGELATRLNQALGTAEGAVTVRGVRTVARSSSRIP